MNRFVALLNVLMGLEITGAIILAFCTGWFFVSLISNGGSIIVDGRFDPGMTVGGYIVNAVQLVYLWVGTMASVSLTHHAKVQAEHQAANRSFHLHSHRELVRIAKQIDSLNEKIREQP